MPGGGGMPFGGPPKADPPNCGSGGGPAPPGPFPMMGGAGPAGTARP